MEVRRLRSWSWPWEWRPRSAPPPRRPRRWGWFLVLLPVLTLLGAGHWLLSHPFGLRSEALLLFLGLDQPLGGASRADTIVLLRIQVAPLRRITALWLPRDTRVRIPGRSDHHKLNAAFAFGGWPLMRETLARNFGVRPEYHLVLRSEGLAALVDALGGIVLDVPYDMDYDDRAQGLHIHLKQGPGQRLEGEQAVGFVRFRSTPQGDLDRIRRQQDFLQALLRQARHPKTLLRLPQILRAMRQAVETDLRPWQVLALAYCLRRAAPSDIEVQLLPGRPRFIQGVSYFLPSTANVTNLLEGEYPPLEEGLEEDFPGRVFVAVLNGTRRAGYARQAARQLKAAGFTIAEVGNAPSQDYERTLLLAPEGTPRGSLERIRMALGCGRIQPAASPRPDGALVVIIGEDFQPRPGL